MEYPLLINGEARGRLTVTQDGLFTVFEALAPAQEELIRLSVYGGGDEGYLGVMQPWSGGLYLRRRLSKSARRQLPETVEYAAPAGCRPADGGKPAAAAEEETDRIEETRPDLTSSPAPSPTPPDAQASPEETQDGGLLWLSRPDGTLTAFDGHGSIIAIPAALRRDAPGAVLRQINGQMYMLFRY